MVKPTIHTEGVRESIRQESTRTKPKGKDRDSQFDRVLKEQSQQLRQPALIRQSITQAATHQGSRQVKREEDRGRQGKSRDAGEEREGQKTSDGERKTDAKSAEQRVVAKKDVKDERHGGQGRGGGGGGSSGKRQAGATRSRLASGRQGPALLKASFAKKLTQAVKEPARAFTERMMNQIIRFVRIGMTSEEEQEVRVELHERFFRGLKLRVVKKGKGLVTVHFMTANSAVREMFQDNSDGIRRALKRKGIDVAEITVA